MQNFTLKTLISALALIFIAGTAMADSDGNSHDGAEMVIAGNQDNISDIADRSTPDCNVISNPLGSGNGECVATAHFLGDVVLQDLTVAAVKEARLIAHKEDDARHAAEAAADAKKHADEDAADAAKHNDDAAAHAKKHDADDIADSDKHFAEDAADAAKHFDEDAADAARHFNGAPEDDARHAAEEAADKAKHAAAEAADAKKHADDEAADATKHAEDSTAHAKKHADDEAADATKHEDDTVADLVKHADEYILNDIYKGIASNKDEVEKVAKTSEQEDIKLGGRIDEETAARKGADTALGGRIDTERAESIERDVIVHNASIERDVNIQNASIERDVIVHNASVARDTALGRRINNNSSRIDDNSDAIEDAIALAAAMPDSWLSDKETFALAVGGGFSEGASAFGAITTFRFNQQFSGYAGGATTTDDTWSVKGGVRVGW